MGLFSNVFGGNKSINGPGAEPLNLGSNSMSELGPFQMTVDDVFSIKGRGTVVTGTVSSGRGNVGDTVMIKRATGEQLTETITGIESMKKNTQAVPGNNVGILFGSLDTDSIGKGDMLVGDSPRNIV